MNLKKKIALLLVGLNVVIALILGCSIFLAAKREFLDLLTRERWNLGVALAKTIDPVKHRQFTDVEALADPDYQRCQKMLNTCISSFGSISHLYTLSYNQKDDKFTYVVDGETVPENTVWLESDRFALETRIDAEGTLCVIHDSREYTQDTEIGTVEGAKVSLSFREQAGRKSLYIDDHRGFTWVTTEPFQVETDAGTLSTTEREVSVEIPIHGDRVPFEISISLKGQPASDPGSIYVDTEEVIDQLQQALKNEPARAAGRLEKGAYGQFLVVYVPIPNDTGQATALVAIESDARVVNDFVRPISRMALTVSLALFVIMLLGSLIATHYIVSPIKALTASSDRIAAGDLEVRTHIRRRDEIGRLASSFDHMAHSLDATQERLRLVVAANQRFVPADLLGLIGRGDVGEVRPGDHVEKTMTVLFGVMEVGDPKRDRLSPEENLALVNEYLRIVSPIVLQNRGILAAHTANILTLLFTDSPIHAVDAALQMQQELRTYNALRKGQGGLPINLAIGMHAGNVMLGIVGNEDRMASTVLSPVTRTAWELATIAKTLGYVSLASDTVLEVIRDDPSRHTRHRGTTLGTDGGESIPYVEILAKPEMPLSIPPFSDVSG